MQITTFKIYVKYDIPNPKWELYRITYSIAERDYLIDTLKNKYDYITAVKFKKCVYN